MTEKNATARTSDNNALSTFKLLLMGESGVGKSSIILRFVEDKFLGENVHAATIGVDFKVKFMDLEDEKIKLTIWDTAGQERFRTLTSSYYRGAHGVILVYDVTSKISFDNVKSVWMRELETYASLDTMVLMVVANKIDKTSQRLVSKEEGLELAKSLSALYMECSAKTKLGITAAFEELVHTIIHSPKLAAARKNAEAATSASSKLNVQRRATENENGASFGNCSC